MSGVLWRARVERAPGGLPSLARAACARLGAEGANELERRVRAENEPDARLQHLAEAIANPPAGVRRSLNQEAIGGEVDRTQGLEPHVVGGLIDGEGKLCLHPRPYVLELGAHGGVYPLLS